MTAPYLNVPVFSWPAAPGGLLYTYAPGGVAAKTTYQEDGTTPNTNPVVLDVNGLATVRGDGLYHFLLKDSTGATTLWDADYYQGATISQASIGLLLYPQTAAELGASVTPTYYYYPPGDVRRYGAVGDGSTDCTTAFKNAALSNKLCTVTAGTWELNSVDVTLDNVWFRGEGWNTILLVGANNSRLFNVTGQQFHVSDTQWQGDGTSSGATNGVAVYLNNAGNALFNDNYSTGFGFGAISGVASSALIGPKVINHKARTTAASGTEIYLGGIWVDTLVENPNFYSTTADRCLLMYDNNTTGWVGGAVRGGTANGYLKQQWAITDENWDGTARVRTFVFDGVRCTNSNWSAIKCKTSRDVKIVNCSFYGCGLAQEDQPNGLYGDVLVNSLGKVTIANNTFQNSGSAAIKCNATAVSQYPNANPGGLAEDLWLISGNQIDTTGAAFSGQGYGISLVNGWKGLQVSGNVMRGLTASGIFTHNTSASPFWDLGIFNNTITDSPTVTAISVGFGQSLRMDGNLVQNCGASGVVITDIPNVQIGPTDMVLDPAVGSGRGYQITNALDVNFHARAGNTTYDLWVALTAYALGARIYNGANVYECVIAGTTANTGGPVHTSGGAADGTATFYFVGKYQLMPYAIRITGSHVKVNLDFDADGCITGPIEALVAGTSGTRVHYTTKIVTTTNTPTNAQVVPLPDVTAWTVECRILAQAVGVGRASYLRYGLVYRAGAGAVLQGVDTPATIESAAAWDALTVITGNNVAPIQVTGAAATNINWKVEVTMLGMP